MTDICPTVTAFNPHDYRTQIEMLEPFAKRLHIDLMDGKFAPTKSPDLEHIWLPDGIVNDVHVMYEKPAPHLERLIELKPSLVIIHYEADVDHKDFSAKLRAAGIRAGLGVLQRTSIEEAKSVLDAFDHIMIFSGNLGHHGSTADLDLLDKVREVQEAYPDMEIAWDGGISDQNAKELVDAGVDALNVGGFIHKAQDPQAAYAKLEAVIGTTNAKTTSGAA
jgi:ribulose-phosphate 3-epimerase